MAVPYYGDFPEDATVRIPFNTFSSDDPQASVTITNLADADLKVHKDGGLTQIVTDGATISIDYDTITGNHYAVIDTSVHADYTTGAEYAVRMEGTTVDAGTINAWIGAFSIERAGGAIALLTGANSLADIETKIDTVDTVVDGIQTDLDNGTDGLGAIKGDTAATLTDTADMQPRVAAIEVDTNELQGDWVNGGRLDLIQDIIAADTTTDIPATITALQNDLDIITDSDGVILGAAGVDLVWDEVLTGGTHNVNNSSGRRLRQLGGMIFTDGTAQAGAANSLQLASGDVTTDNQYKRSKVIITSGTGSGQEAIITSSTASTDTVFVTPAWLVTPDNTSDYEVLPAQVHSTVRNGGYDGGFVYVDTINGNTGQVEGVNGTTTNPCKNLTDAYVIAGLESLEKFSIHPGSDIVLPSDSTTFQFVGSQYTVDLSGQEIGSCGFSGAFTVFGTGINTSGSNQPVFEMCIIGTATLPPFVTLRTAFTGVITLGTAGNITISNGSAVIGSSLTLNFGAALNASSVFNTQWRGGTVEIQNAGAGTGSYVYLMSGNGDLLVNANCSATTQVTLQGNISRNADVTGVTYVETANNPNLNSNVLARIPAALIGGRMDSDIEAINNSTSAAVNLGASALGIVATSVNDASASTTSFIISSAEATDDHFNGRVIVFTSGVLVNQATDITDYVGSTKAVTVTALTEAPADTDTFVIV